MYFHTSRNIYAHIDCNSFYASCEVLRDPRLKGRPIVVGDQITIAASYEAKRLGIRVGTPFWEAERIVGRSLMKKHPDHPYYRGISDRLMAYLSERLGKLQVFSIDETFADVSGMSDDYEGFAQKLMRDIAHDIGLPVSIGIANTRIRAKMFGDLHKPSGTTVLFGRDEILETYARLPVREIPFIGRGSADRLGSHIATVKDYYDMRLETVRSVLGRSGVSLWLDLHGIDAWTPHDTAKKRKSIVVSRSFNSGITSNPHFLWRQVLIHFERAYETLMGESQGARLIGVFLRHRDFSYSSKYADLGETTIDRSHMIETLRTLMREVYNREIEYRTVGITLGHLSPFSPRQLSVDDIVSDRYESDTRLSDTLSRLRTRYGDSVIHQGYVAPVKREGVEVLMEVG